MTGNMDVAIMSLFEQTILMCGFMTICTLQYFKIQNEVYLFSSLL